MQTIRKSAAVLPRMIQCAIAILAIACARGVEAQAPLRILQYSPADSMRPGSVITVTLSRPVAADLDQTVAASSVMKVEPSIRGLFEWRDPVTLRFTPLEPMPAGARLQVSIDTSWLASGGKRHNRPFTFAIPVPPVRYLINVAQDQSIVGASFEGHQDRRFRVLYSAPIDIESFARISVLEFPESCGGAIAFQNVHQRELTKDEKNYQSWTDDDSLAARALRFVEMVPSRELPFGCSGVWKVPLFNDHQGRSYYEQKFRTYPEFRIDSVAGCFRERKNASTPCNAGSMSVWFSAPVDAATFKSFLRLSPDVSAQLQNKSRSMVAVYKPPLRSATSYSIVADSGLRDVFGRRLVGSSAITVTTPDREPAVFHQSELVTLSGAAPSIRVRSVNVDSLIVAYTVVPDSMLGEILASPTFDGYHVRDSLLKLPSREFAVSVRGVLNEEHETEIPLSEVFTNYTNGLVGVRFAIKSANGVSRPQSKPGVFTLFVQRSNLRAYSKLVTSSGAVLVTDVRGAGVADAAIELRDGGARILGGGTTDSLGMARLIPHTLPLVTPELRRWTQRSTRYLQITAASEHLIVPIQSPLGNTLDAQLAAHSLGASGESGGPMHGAVFADRGIYKPGEPVYVKTYARFGTGGNGEVPDVDSIRFRIYRFDDGSWDSDDVEHKPTALNEFGAAVDTIIFPPTARLGRYRIVSVALVKGEWYAVGTTDVRLAEFRAPEFLIELTSDSANRFTGDTIPVDVAGRYLMGTAMRGARVEWFANTVAPADAPRRIPHAEGYTVGDAAWWGGSSDSFDGFSSGEGVLDAGGRFSMRISTDRANQAARSTLNVRVEVTDATNQTTAREFDIPLRQSAIHVAAKVASEKPIWKTGVAPSVQTIVVNDSGEVQAGVPISVVVVRRRWVSDTAADSPLYNWIADTVQRTQLVSAVQPVQFEFTPIAEGAYDVRFSAPDVNGRNARTNIGRWVYDEPWDDRFGPNQLRLAISKAAHTREEYSVGDTARMTFESPFERATAWLTVEREGILEQQLLTVKRGSNSFALPITSRHAPNIWIGIVLANQPADGPDELRADAPQEQLRAGYLEIRVDSTAHSLDVKVRHLSRKLSPGDSVHVEVRVNDRSGGAPGSSMRSEVAVWAVDEGVLSLTDYRAPDILRMIDARQGVAASFYATLTELPWRSVRASPTIGVLSRGRGVGFSGALSLQANVAGVDVVPPHDDWRQNPRSQFRFTAFFVGSAVTDGDGIARMSAKLPDNITTFRLMATAVTQGNRYGSGETSLVVNRRIVARAALPRFVRAGDSLRFGVIANLTEGLEATVAAEVSASGNSLRGDRTRSLQIRNADGPQTYFNLKVNRLPQAETLSVNTVVRDLSANDGDALTTTLPIRPDGTSRSHTVNGVMMSSSDVRVSLPAETDPERSTVSISLGTSPLVAMRTYYDRLQEYQHRSTEVVTTSARALLSLSRAERAMNDIPPARDSAEVQRTIQLAVNEIEKRELQDGRIGNWPRIGVGEDAWFSAYVGLFLLDAKDAGATVSEGVLSRIGDLLSEVLEETSGRKPAGTLRVAQSRDLLHASNRRKIAALNFLRRSGEERPAIEDSMTARVRDLSWEDRLALIEILAERDDREEQARSMLQDAWRKVSVIGKRVEISDSLFDGRQFPSRLRPASLLLTTTQTLLPEHPLLGPLTETLIQHGSANRWSWNSLDYAAAIVGLGGFVNEQRGSNGSRIVATGKGGKVLLDASRSSASKQQPGVVDSAHSLSGLLDGANRDSVALRLKVRIVDSSATRAMTQLPLYFSVTVKELSRTQPTTPDIKGLFVERWYENPTTGKPVSSAIEGETVRVRFRVTVPADRQFVALEDLLPAGLEPTDSTETSTHWSPWEYSEMRDDRVFFFARELWTGTYSASYLARATTVGRFIKPPAHAEEIYNAAVQGRTEGGVFVVHPRR